MPAHIFDGSTQIEGVLRVYTDGGWTDEGDNLWAYDGSQWQLIQPYADSALNPPENLVVSDIGSDTATVNWDDPAQDITPTHVQVRIPEETVIWTEYDYPYTDGFTWPTLSPSTAYQFQVRYMVRVDGIVTLQSAAASVFFNTLAPTAPSLPGPDPGGSGPDSIIRWPPPPGGGAGCDWEYIVQELDLDWIWVDTAVTGTQDGAIEDMAIDFVALGIECGTVCRLKFRENCGGVLGPYDFGGSFVVMCDYADDCGGVSDSEAWALPLWSDAILAMPQICYDPETEQQTIEDFVTNQTYSEGPGYYAPGIVDGTWVLNGAPTNVEQGTLIAAGYNSNLQDINETTDCSFHFHFNMSEQPTTGPFPATKLAVFGKLVVFRAYAEGAGVTISVTFPKDGGGAFTLSSTTELPLNEWHMATIAIDVDGDKILYINGAEDVVDADTSAPAFQTLSSELELYGNESARVGPVGAWERVLTADDLILRFQTRVFITGETPVFDTLIDDVMMYVTTRSQDTASPNPTTATEAGASVSKQWTGSTEISADFTWDSSGVDAASNVNLRRVRIGGELSVTATTNDIIVGVNLGRMKAVPTVANAVSRLVRETGSGPLDLTMGAATAGGTEMLVVFCCEFAGGTLASTWTTIPAGFKLLADSERFITMASGQILLVGAFTGPYTTTILTWDTSANHTAHCVYGFELVPSQAKLVGFETMRDDGTYLYHIFTTAGSAPVDKMSGVAPPTVEVFAVGAGGGGQGSGQGGGGGGGEVLVLTGVTPVLPATAVVGAGGAGTQSVTPGVSGTASTLFAITADPGIGGGTTASKNGGASGSGNAGGAGVVGTSKGGGGGGNSAPGTAAVGTTSGNGGAGTSNSWVTGAAQGYGGGGGGGGDAGGAAGTGADGGTAGSAAPVTATRGGGGGGKWQSFPAANGATGGPGVIVIRYLK